MGLPKIIFSDFDGTLTDGERLHQNIFDIFNWCHRHQIPLVIVSGRSLSWAHFLLTHTTVAYAVMEGGGVMAWRAKDQSDISQQTLVSEKNLAALRKIAEDIVKKFKISLTADSLGRIADRAIDKILIEKDPELKLEVELYLKDSGASFSYSSVHLNFWVGNFSKAEGAKRLLEKFFPHLSSQDSLFFGDAPNDESMFHWAGSSVGVSNIQDFLPQMTSLPKLILKGKENRGPFGVLNYLKSLSP